MSQLTKGYLIAIIGVAIWSTTGVFIAYLIDHYGMQSLVLAFWRNLLVCVCLAPVLFVIRRSLLQIDRSQVGFYLFYGLMLALFNSIWTLAVEANGAAVATVLGYSSTGFTAILARWLFKEKLGVHKVLAVILSLGGCVLVAKAYSAQVWQLNPLAVTTGLLSGLFFAGYSLCSKEAARRKLNPWTSLLYSFAFGTLFIVLFNLFPALPGAGGSLRGLLPSLPAAGWLVLVVLSFGPTVLGFGLYTVSMDYLPASIANLLATSEPVMTAVESYIFLRERMTLLQVIGSLVILSAVVIVQFEKE